MVPFSFPQPRLKSLVMNKYISSSATVGVWAWGLELDVFILSCFPYFNLGSCLSFVSFVFFCVLKKGSSVTLEKHKND
jgi:hypothetical protein